MRRKESSSWDAVLLTCLALVLLLLSQINPIAIFVRTGQAGPYPISMQYLPLVMKEPTPTPNPTPTPVPPTPTPTPFPSQMQSPEYGFHVFIWWDPITRERDLRLVKEAGFTWIKQTFAWKDIEGAGKGIFDWSRADQVVDDALRYGLSIMARVDHQPNWARSGCSQQGPPNNYQDYADFLFALASRYKGRIRAYQIWNEPNLADNWCNQSPDPKNYVKLLKKAYQAIKQADPNAMVISAGLAPTTRWDRVAVPDVVFLQRMYDAGAKPYFDVLGAHGAGYKAPPEMDPGEVARNPNFYNVGDVNCPGDLCRIYCFRHVEDIRQIMVQNGDGDKQVAVVEFGWTSDPRPNSSYHWHAVSEEEKADYLVGAYQWAKQNWPWVGVMSAIYIADPHWTPDNEQYWWAVTYPDGTTRLAYDRLRAMPK